MNFFMVLIVVISAWMTFSVLNELASAKDGEGCCAAKNCGEGMIASSLWWLNLIVAVLFTIYALMKVYYTYARNSGTFIFDNPVTENIAMVFGD